MRKTTTFKALVAAVAAGGTLLAPVVAHAQEFMLRARALNLQSENTDGTGLGLSVNDRTFPEIDLSWFMTPSFAIELVLTYPQKHDLRSGGARIGELKHLPPTLLAQYHFTGLGVVRPYFGAGLNYTRLSGVKFDPVVASLNPSLDSDSYGLALQFGVDYEVRKNVFVNFDIKKVQIGFDVKSSGNKLGDFKLDPLLVGLGIGYRF